MSTTIPNPAPPPGPGGYGTGKVEEFRIVQGGEYLYDNPLPEGCRGGRYKVHRVDILDVPSYQHKVLVECLEGQDRGLWFVVSPANFACRYRPAGTPAEGSARTPIDEPAPGNGAGLRKEGD